MILLLFLFFVGCAVKCDESNYYVVEMPEENQPVNKLEVYWNVPTMQCSSKKIPFENLERFGIIQNKNDSFRGEMIAILYDPGIFPALFRNESSGQLRYRNGGVPQEGNLELHLKNFIKVLNQSIPDKNFSGIGIIDFESWRPIFRQNFGDVLPYKSVSIEIEQQKHWWWPQSWTHSEAKRRFEEAARIFMQTTISIAKQIRPKARWGYYGFPYCFNVSPQNMKENCANNVSDENDQISWLWMESTALYPSVYSSKELSSRQLSQLIRGRVKEAVRVRRKDTPILPYFWFRYRDGGYLNEIDLHTALETFNNSAVSGFIVWGSSNDVNTIEKCHKLHNYIETVFGPAVAKYTTNNYKDKHNYVHDINDSSNIITTTVDTTTSIATTTIDINTTKSSFNKQEVNNDAVTEIDLKTTTTDSSEEEMSVLKLNSTIKNTKEIIFSRSPLINIIQHLFGLGNVEKKTESENNTKINHEASTTPTENYLTTNISNYATTEEVNIGEVITSVTIIPNLRMSLAQIQSTNKDVDSNIKKHSNHSIEFTTPNIIQTETSTYSQFKETEDYFYDINLKDLKLSINPSTVALDITNSTVSNDIYENHADDDILELLSAINKDLKKEIPTHQTTIESQNKLVKVSDKIENNAENSFNINTEYTPVNHLTTAQVNKDDKKGRRKKYTKNILLQSNTPTEGSSDLGKVESNEKYQLNEFLKILQTAQKVNQIRTASSEVIEERKSYTTTKATVEDIQTDIATKLSTSGFTEVPITAEAVANSTSTESLTSSAFEDHEQVLAFVD